jgi:rfaE bifunctional protein kinase chain/domain
VRPEDARFGEILDGFVGRRVLVVGDLIADEYIYGETARLSREAPVMILRHESRRVIPGGAGNAVLNLRALGAEPVPLAVVGDGETSREMLAEFTRRGIDTDSVIRDPERVAVRKTRVMAGAAHGQKQQVLRIDHEDSTPIPPTLERRLVERAEAILSRVDAVLLSDYGYGTLDAGIRDPILAAARRAGLPVCADSRYRLRDFRGVTWATPNEDEAEDAWGRSIRDESDLREAAETLRDELDAEFLLLTRGRDGMAIIERGGAFHTLPVFGTAEAADVTGAGDTVAAVSVLSIAGGATPVEAAQVATVAAGIVVQKHGAATTSREEIERVANVRRQSPHA